MFHLLEFQEGVAVVPDCWVLKESFSCYWPQGIGATQWAKIGKAPILNHKDWPIYPYLRILKSGNYEKMKRAEVKSLDNTDISSSCSEQVYESEKRKRKQKQQWDTEFKSEMQSKKLVKRSCQCLSSSSEEELQPSQTVMHKSLPAPPSPFLVVPTPSPCHVVSTASPRHFLPTASPRLIVPVPSHQMFSQSSAHSASTTLPGIVKQAVAEAVRPFFQSVFKQLEELKAEIKEQGQKHTQIGQTTTATLPETLTFPLQEINDLLEFNRILMEDSEQRSRTINYLARIGGSSLEDCLRKVAKAILTAQLSMQYNFTGRKGKLEFSGLLGVKDVIYDAVRKNYPQATISQLDKILSKWLSGSIDRDGLKKIREDKRKSLENPGKDI